MGKVRRNKLWLIISSKLVRSVNHSFWMLTRQDTITALAPSPSTFTPHPTGQKYMGEGSVIRFVIKWGGIESEGGGREGEVTLLSRESKQCCYKHDSDTIKTSIQHTHIHSIHTQSYTQLRDPYITYLLRRTSRVNHSWDNTQQISNIYLTHS